MLVRLYTYTTTVAIIFIGNPAHCQLPTKQPPSNAVLGEYIKFQSFSSNHSSIPTIPVRLDAIGAIKVEGG